MESGVPILANWKSHPYLDVEVIQWYARILAADRLHKAKDEASRNQAARQLVDRYGITHLVVQNRTFINLPDLVEVYSDQHDRIYRRTDQDHRQR